MTGCIAQGLVHLGTKGALDERLLELLRDVVQRCGPDRPGIQGPQQFSRIGAVVEAKFSGAALLDIDRAGLAGTIGGKLVARLDGQRVTQPGRADEGLTG